MALPLAAAFTRFLGVGVVGLAVDATLFSVLDACTSRRNGRAPPRSLLATFVTWRLNRRHTFAASGRQPRRRGAAL